ncbi:GNAT family N-acetyltransferase [Arthrobacter bambusae]
MALEDDRPIGCAFGSNDPEDVLHWRAAGHAELAQAISRRLFMVHQLAVAATHRRLGLGAHLLGGLELHARQSGADLIVLIFDTTAPGLDCFYRSQSCEILEPGQALVIEFSEIKRLCHFRQRKVRYSWAYKFLGTGPEMSHDGAICL